MNLRELKNREKSAMRALIRKHGFSRSDFDPSDGTEALYAPIDLDPQNTRHGFIHPGTLKGTPLIWERTSYEYDEWDARLPSQILADLEFDWDTAMDAAMDALLPTEKSTQ